MIFFPTGGNFFIVLVTHCGDSGALGHRPNAGAGQADKPCGQPRDPKGQAAGRRFTGTIALAGQGGQEGQAGGCEGQRSMAAQTERAVLVVTSAA